MQLKVVILTTDSEKGRMLYWEAQKQFQVEKVILEDSVPRKQLIRKRIKKMGMLKVLGQILFIGMVSRPLEMQSGERILEIKKENSLNDQAIPETQVLRVHSVNEKECMETLQQLKPQVILVHGTRIISSEVLHAVSCPFINMHAGITPLYRGVHGGYWALAEQDKEHCGVTVHLVDEGIDTGSVFYQSLISVTDKDNFATYPYLQFAKGVTDMMKAVKDVEAGRVQTKKVSLPSKFRTHPTIWEYCKYKKKYGVK